MYKHSNLRFSFAHMYVILFITICFMALFGMAYRFFINQLSVVEETQNKSYTGSEYVFEFDEDPALIGAVSPEEKKVKEPSSAIRIIKNIDIYVDEFSVAADDMALLGIKVKKLTGLPPEFTIQDEPIVVKLSNDMLSYVYDYVDNSQKIESIIAFSDFLEKYNSKLLYVHHPAIFQQALYKGFYDDYSNEMSREITKGLKEADIPVISLNEEIERANLDRSSLFFKTDHHWLPQAGIWATGILSQKLNKDFGYSIDISLFDEDNYDVDVKEKFSLGSYGKKVTRAYTELEDFFVVTPKYETDLTVFRSYDNTTQTGTIQETLYNYSAIDSEAERNPEEVLNYELYGYKDRALVRIHNNKLSDGSHILIIKDSFANVMYPYMAAGVEYLDVLDLRHFEGSLRAYIQETRPDTVVIIYGTTFFCDKAYDRVFNFN